MTEQAFAEPVWKAQRSSADQSVVITPCMPVDMRLMEVRIPWEPSSFLEDNDRKNLYVELRDPMIRAYLQRQEESLSTESWGQVSSCLAKEGLVRCKISLKNVHVFDRQARNHHACPVCRACLQRLGQVDRQVADARRLCHGLKPAGDRPAGAPRQ